MKVHGPKTKRLESETISRVLIIADASRQALAPVLDSLQTVREEHLHSVSIILISFLSDTLKKHLGPNILGLLAREETETLAKATDLFGRISIPFDLKVIIAPPWKAVLDEIGDRSHDLLILQGEFLDLWRERATTGCPSREMMESHKFSVLAINRCYETMEIL